ncbi:MAG TPA: MFS transporter, partial [Mycobacteriales bacterium]|nr:MFS transporter [Mycobacteriales bacterium]
VLSMGIFFTIITLGLAATLPSALGHGLTAQGVPAAQAHAVASLPPIGLLFAAFLGFNPIHQLLPSAAAAHVSTSHYAFLTGRGFFPSLIAGPFGHGLHAAFAVAAVLCVIAAICSWLRGAVPMPGAAEVRESGFTGAGDVAMQEVGAGASLD